MPELDDAIDDLMSLPTANTSVSMPAKIRGAIDLSTYAGVTLGAVDGTTRTANATALQAALDYAASNGKFVEVSSELRHEYNATRVLSGKNAGLQIPPGINGVRCHPRANFVQYATNHPVLSIGVLDGSAGIGTIDLELPSVKTGVSQSGQTQGVGFRWGFVYNCKIPRMQVENDGAGYPYIGVYINDGVFFQNVVHLVWCSGLQNHFYRNADGTGDAWHSIYLGGGGNEANVQTIGADPMVTQNCDMGHIDQLNIEWTQGSRMMKLDNMRGMDIDHIHFEGNRITGSGPDFIHVSYSDLMIRRITALNNDTRTATGVVKLVTMYQNAQVQIDDWDIRFKESSGDYGSNDKTLQLFTPDITSTGPLVTIRNVEINPWNPHPQMNCDDYLTASTVGAPKAIKEYTWEGGYGATDGAQIMLPGTSGAATLYACHRNATIVQNDALTAQRDVTLAGFDMPSGLGSASPRKAGDRLFVQRFGGGAFNLRIMAADGSTVITTLTGAGSKRLTYNGTAWTAY